MSLVGIVGAEDLKFTPDTKAAAFKVIRSVLNPGDVVVSGGCHLGGVDIWAEVVAAERGLTAIVYKPTRLTWDPGPPHVGYKERNINIAEASHIVHVITVKTLPPGFLGMKHPLCYHCHTTSHVKSGGCWTGKYAEKLGKPVIWWEL